MQAVAVGKYEPLKRFLTDPSATELPMSFDEIEQLIEGHLPAAAFSHRAWWSNNPSNNVMTRAWLDAGYKTERVDMTSRKLVFVRKSDGGKTPESPPSPTPTTSIGPRRGFLARLREALGGTVTIPPGVDVTKPTGEIWDAEG